MPKKKPTQEGKLPPYLSPDGTLDLNKVFEFQPKQKELLRSVNRNGGIYTQAAAPQCMSVGGIRSGKTAGILMFMVMHYCLAFEGCDILVLRRTFKELESGAIADFKTFAPRELYEYDQTKHVATFMNGSRVVFGHCQNNKERDIEQYLGQAYPGILVDECGQFSPDAWQMLYSRNTVNAACKADSHGNMPIPVIWGATNPLGPHYEYYRTLFVDKKPWNPPEGAKEDPVNGTWWSQQSGEWFLIYDPKDYACQRSTVLDNPALLARDPGIIPRLNSLPKAKRDKMLLGLDGAVEGQYFDVWDETYHVVNLREDPTAIIWQDYQPVWIGQDWGMKHANAAYFFTKALVKSPIGNDYKLKTVCFQEVVLTGGKTYLELASILAGRAKLPNGLEVKVKNIFFSHEKFSRQMEAHSPADDYSRALRARGLPPVTRATQDRIASASFMYNELKNGNLVVLDYCKEIILTIPGLMRDPDNMDDVLKTEAKGDDCYDGFRYGLFGMLNTRKKPAVAEVQDQYKEMLKKDPLAAWFWRQKMMASVKDANAPFVPERMPPWMAKHLAGE